VLLLLPQHDQGSFVSNPMKKELVVSEITAPNYPPAEPGKYQPLGWMPVEKYLALKRNIASVGRVEVPITMCGDDVLDGYHRKLAYDELKAEGWKIEPPAAAILSGLDEDAKRHVAIRANCCRRQVSPKKLRKVIAAELKRLPDLCNAWLADLCGTSDKTVASVRRELERMSEIPTVNDRKRRDGKSYPRVLATNPRQFQRAKKMLSLLPEDVPGKTISLSTADHIARDDFRRQIADKNVRPLSDDNYRLIHCDFRELPVENDSVRVVLTDPLYEGGALEHWEQLANFSERVLSPGGLLIAYSGIQFLPQVIEYLGAKLKYVWTLAVFHPGGSPYVAPLRGRSKWRPILVFSKGDAEFSAVSDVIPAGSREKQFHDFQQPLGEATYLIEHFSQEGDLICDPFAGSFTNAVAAYMLGRRFIGSDIVEDNVKIGNYRMAFAAQNQAAATDALSLQSALASDSRLCSQLLGKGPSVAGVRPIDLNTLKRPA